MNFIHLSRNFFLIPEKETERGFPPKYYMKFLIYMKYTSKYFHTRKNFNDVSLLPH